MKIDTTESPARAGHPVSVLEVDVDELDRHPGAIEDIFSARRTGIVVRGAFPEARAAAARLADPALGEAWAFPNAGMTGGEVRVIGEAATPTFTKMRGPSVEVYGREAARQRERMRAIFGDTLRPAERVAAILSSLFGGRPAAPAAFDDDTPWSPFTVRALDPGEQIYSHHDNHYGLAVYERLAADLDRETLISWFVTLQPAERGGELIVYGLWGSDPDPPMLPTRFLDTEALERRFARHAFDLRAGDLVAFDAGRHVHRVSPVEGARPRLTLGGFLTIERARRRLAFWS